MAENKQERKTIQVGDQKYLVDDILGLSAAQLNNYFTFAREKGGYDDEGIASLRNYINKRLDNIKAGQGFNADGSFDGDVVENVTMKVKKPGGFGKKEITQGNRDWANNYFYHLIKNLKPYQETEDKSSANTWDISKHGLDAYLTGQGLDAKHIFENYDLKDPNNPTAARSFTQRRELLKQHLGGYRDWLKSKGFDFTKNDNEWDDNYLTDFESFVNNFDTLDNNALTTALRKYGAGNYTTAFTSDKWDLTKTNEEIAEDARKQTQAEADKQRQAHLNEYEDYAYSQKRESNPLYHSPFDYSNYNFNGKEANFRNWYGDLNASEQVKYGTYLGIDNAAWDKAWRTYTNSLKNGSTYSDKNLGILLQGTFESNPHGFIDLGDGHYLIRDSVTDSGQGTIYNPKSGYTDTVFLGDLAGSNADIKNIYRQLAYKYANAQHGTNYEDRPDVFEQGGTLVPSHQYGNKVTFNWGTTDEIIEPKAKANGVDVKTQKARDQYLNEDNKSIDNPNAGFKNLTGAQQARVLYAALDLASAGAALGFGAGSVVSAATGLVSTFGNLYSDITDDAVTSGQAWKNFGMNLGMDALGLIPGGGAASKLGKIVKSLKPVVPAVIALPGVVNMLSNSPEIAASWKKAFDGDPEKGGSKMDYQDYMNILQVLNVATGMSTIAANKYQASKRAIKQTDKLAVDVIDGNKQRRALVLEGDDISKFKEANAKGEAQKFIDELEGPNKYTINEVIESNKGKFWGKNDEGKFKWQNPLGQSHTGKANTLELKWDSKKKSFYAETGKWDADLGRNNGELINVSENRKSRYEAEMGRLQGDLDAVTGKMKESMAARTKRTDQIKSELAPEKARLAELQAKLKGVPDASALQTNKTQLEADLATLESQITTRQQAVATAEADLQRLLGDPNTASNNEAIKSARGKVQGHKTTLQGYESTKQRHLTGLADIDQQLQIHSELPIAQARISRLEGILEKLNPSKHTHAYNKLQQMVADYKTNHSAIEGSTVNWDMDEILRNAGIRDAFKQGGNINKSKINKFLKYAKG